MLEITTGESSSIPESASSEEVQEERTNAKFPGGKPSFSHSAMETWSKCGELYRLYYLDTEVARPPGAFAYERVIGQVVHSALENYHRGNNTGRARPFLERYWQRYFQKIELPNLYALIQDYITDIEVLLTKADKDYIGDDAIRTKEGKVPKHPTMTDAFNQLAKGMNLDRRKRVLDAAVVARDPEYTGTSVVDIFQETFKILDAYQHPEHIAEVEEVEKRLKGVRYPTTGKALTGLIDIVGRTPDGSLMIVDHKTTSRTHRDSYKVSYSEQLLLYGWSYYQMTKKVPEYIAINFVRANTLVAAHFDMTKAEESLKRREEIIRAILMKVFIKRAPDEFGSPCYFEGRKVACAYLSKCYPEFYEQVKAKIEPEKGN